MAPIGVSRAIEIVFEEIDRSSDAFVAEALFGCFGQLLKNSLTGAIMNDRIFRVVTLSSCIFGMGANVEVQPRSIFQKDIRASSPRNHLAEEVSRDLVGTQSSLTTQYTRDAVFGFDTDDSTHATPRATQRRRRRQGA
jgi:hypothetical protein